MSNYLNYIHPFKERGQWMFTDREKGLTKELLVGGTDSLLDTVTGGAAACTLIFSAGQFPGYTHKLVWQRQGDGGNWYKEETLGLPSWLCPALFEYFPTAPDEIYVQVIPRVE